MHRFFVAPDSISSDSAFLKEKDLIHQLTKVLRIQAGDQIILLDNSGLEYSAEIIEISKKEIQARIINQKQNTSEPDQEIVLYQALPKNPGKFEQVIQHGTEIGIVKFVPVITERTEVQKIRNLERAQRIIRESAEQSERGKLPELSEPISWNKIWSQKEQLQHLEQAKSRKSGTSDRTIPSQFEKLERETEQLEHVNLVADSYAAKPLLGELLPEIKNEKTINIFIGPEGGLTKNEIELAKNAGALTFSLGPRVLRTETAGLSVASAILFS